MRTINVTAKIVLFEHRDGKKIDSKKEKKAKKENER